MELNTRQKKVVQANDRHILCLSAAASGKTRTLTERVRYLIDTKQIPPEKVVAITFTNMASEEMRRRLGPICDKAFVGTVHSYANKICISQGIDTQRWIMDFNFDEIIRRALTIPVLKYPHVNHILIDECQDLSPLEYNFLERIPADNRFYCGDSRQNIYSFKGCTDEFLRAMYLDEDYKKYYLIDNYRNAPNIIEFANDFIRDGEAIGPGAQAVKKEDGNVVECSFIDAIEELEWSGNWGAWFILTRTNNELAKAQEMLDEKGIPNVTFKKGDLDVMELDALMATNRVKVLTVHSAKGLEAKNVIVTGAKTYNEDERKICYVAATRAENNLYWCPQIAGGRKKGRGMNNKAEAGRFFEKTNFKTIKF